MRRTRIDLEIALRQCHDALDELTALWIDQHGADYNAIDKALSALSASLSVLPSQSLTVSIAPMVAEIAGQRVELTPEEASQ